MADKEFKAIFDSDTLAQFASEMPIDFFVDNIDSDTTENILFQVPAGKMQTPDKILHFWANLVLKGARIESVFFKHDCLMVIASKDRRVYGIDFQLAPNAGDVITFSEYIPDKPLTDWRADIR